MQDCNRPYASKVARTDQYMEIANTVIFLCSPEVSQEGALETDENAPQGFDRDLYVDCQS